MIYFRFLLVLVFIGLTLLKAQASSSEKKEGAKMVQGRFVNGGKSPHTRKDAPNVIDEIERLVNRSWVDDNPLDPIDIKLKSVMPDLSFLKSNRSQVTFTWLGHSSCLVQMGGQTFLTDPHLTERASPVSFIGPKRLFPSPISLKNLPRIDVVIISHSHYDHLDLPTLKSLSNQTGGSPLFLVPLKLKTWMQNQGIPRTEELDWWQSFVHEGQNYTLVPAHHWSSRVIWDRNKTLWGGWVVQSQNFKFYYTGDTGYSDIFPQIASLGPFDLSAIAIGSYEPRWFMKIHHVNPEEAVRIHEEIGSKLSVGVHWGTFKLSSEDLNQPPRDLKEALIKRQIDKKEFVTLPPGQTLRFPLRTPTD